MRIVLKSKTILELKRNVLSLKCKNQITSFTLKNNVKELKSLLNYTIKNNLTHKLFISDFGENQLKIDLANIFYVTCYIKRV